MSLHIFFTPAEEAAAAEDMAPAEEAAAEALAALSEADEAAAAAEAALEVPEGTRAVFTFSRASTHIQTQCRNTVAKARQEHSEARHYLRIKNHEHPH